MVNSYYTLTHSDHTLEVITDLALHHILHEIGKERSRRWRLLKEYRIHHNRPPLRELFVFLSMNSNTSVIGNTTGGVALDWSSAIDHF